MSFSGRIEYEGHTLDEIFIIYNCTLKEQCLLKAFLYALRNYPKFI